MANYKKWTDSELVFVRENHERMNDLELSAKLSQITGQNISTAMVRRQRRKLNIKKQRGRPAKNKNNQVSGAQASVWLVLVYLFIKGLYGNIESFIFYSGIDFLNFGL